jgi:CHAT domain-containing protein
MNLMGTELVALSGCMTGRGQYLPGEGLFGLQRSLRVAGAKSVLLSLFPIPDRETARTMETFYRRWTGGDSKLTSLRSAKIDLISELRQRDGVAHPYYWAGLVLVGDPE